MNFKEYKNANNILYYEKTHISFACRVKVFIQQINYKSETHISVLYPKYEMLHYVGEENIIL